MVTTVYLVTYAVWLFYALRVLARYLLFIIYAVIQLVILRAGSVKNYLTVARLSATLSPPLTKTEIHMQAHTPTAPLSNVLSVIAMTHKDFWLQQAPAFNFELGVSEIVARALKVGYLAHLTDTRVYVHLINYEKLPAQENTVSQAEEFVIANDISDKPIDFSSLLTATSPSGIPHYVFSDDSKIVLIDTTFSVKVPHVVIVNSSDDVRDCLTEDHISLVIDVT